MLKEEFEVAFELLDGEEMDMQGNIIAALSARYCDLKLQKFFEELKRELKNDFVFVVTAVMAIRAMKCRLEKKYIIKLIVKPFTYQ